MKFGKIVSVLALTLCVAVPAFAQAGDVEVDYNHPKRYVVGGVRVEGNSYFKSAQIISQAGVREGASITVPGEEVSAMVNRLMLQKFFDSVSVEIDSLSSSRDTAFLAIKIKERPRVSQWTFSGIKSGERKDIEERVNLKRGREFSEYVEKTTSDIIKRYFAEKGFLKCEVSAEVKRDTIIKNAIQVNFAVNKGEKIKIKDINFIGNDHVRTSASIS